MGELIALAEPLVAIEPESVSAAWQGLARALSQRSMPVTQGVDPGDIHNMEDRSATFGVDAGLVVLGSLYDLVGPGQVARFLRKRQDLILPLAAIHQELMRQVDAVGPVALECVADPEDNFDYLAVSVSVPGSPKRVLQALRAFDDWWLTLPAAVRTAVVVTTVPV